MPPPTLYFEKEKHIKLKKVWSLGRCASEVDPPLVKGVTCESFGVSLNKSCLLLLFLKEVVGVLEKQWKYLRMATYIGHTPEMVAMEIRTILRIMSQSHERRTWLPRYSDTQSFYSK